MVQALLSALIVLVCGYIVCFLDVAGCVMEVLHHPQAVLYMQLSKIRNSCILWYDTANEHNLKFR